MGDDQDRRNKTMIKEIKNMGIWERAGMIAKSNINDLLNKFEDPNKMVDQAIREAKDDFMKQQKAAAEVLAHEKRMKHQIDEANENATKWHTIAANALKSGNEADARAALAKEKEYKNAANGLLGAYQSAKDSADNVRTSLQRMQETINEMESNAAQIKAMNTSAKVRQQAVKFNPNGANKGAEVFTRMKEKAETNLAQAEAMEDFSGMQTSTKDAERDLLKKYSAGPDNTDAALEALKAEIGSKEQ